MKHSHTEYPFPEDKGLVSQKARQPVASALPAGGHVSTSKFPPFLGATTL